MSKKQDSRKQPDGKQETGAGNQAGGHDFASRKFTLRQWRAFQLVIGLAALWWLVLLVGVLQTANPPMLPAYLVSGAEIVVQAKSGNGGESDGLEVEQCWSHPTKDVSGLCEEMKTVPRNLFPAETKILKGTSYLIPLRKTKEGWQWLKPIPEEEFDPQEVAKKSAGRQPAAPQLVPLTSMTMMELQRALEDLKKPVPVEGN